jgi:imidazolonepropionase-like amidohydrolase
LEVSVTSHPARRLFALTLALALVQAGGARIAGESPGQQPRAPRLVALKGATLLTVTRGTIPNGTILLRDGTIAAVGAAVDVPSGAEVVDVSGRFISPGVIDAHTHLANDSINEGGTTVSSMTGMEDVLDPTDVNIYRDLAGGVTTANVLHGSANPIGGKNAVIKLRWGKTRGEELLFAGAMPGIKFALGEDRAGIRSRAAAWNSSSATRSYGRRRTRKRGSSTRRTRRRALRRGATCSSSRSSRSSRASVWSTRTAIAPMKS